MVRAFFFVLSVFGVLGSPVQLAQAQDHTVSDAQKCTLFQSIEEKFNDNGPVKSGPASEMLSISVDCQDKTITYKQRILIDPADLRDGWQDRKQEQHTRLHCNQKGIASLVKWNAVTDLYDPKNVYIAQWVTTPDDC
ncbi:MAG: hypothetical protein AAGE61_17295 [Pseudomonadota bacterium]